MDFFCQLDNTLFGTTIFYVLCAHKDGGMCKSSQVPVNVNNDDDKVNVSEIHTIPSLTSWL